MIKQQIFPTLFPVKGFFYVSLLLGILKEITGSSLTRKTDSEEEVAAVFDLVQKVFQRMLECMARSFKKQPEEGLQVWAPSLAGSELEGQRPAGGPGCGARPLALPGRCHAAGGGCQGPLPSGAAPLPGAACSGEGGQGAKSPPLSPGLGTVLAIQVSGPLAWQDRSRELIAVACEYSAARSEDFKNASLGGCL